MKNLEKEYDINRYDIKTSEKLILKEYSEIIKSREQFDVRLEHYTGEKMLIIKQKSLKRMFSLAKEIPEEIIKLAEIRQKARENKDWAESDRIRDEITKMGYMIKDTKNGYELT